jgi:hypothetical protein
MKLGIDRKDGNLRTKKLLLLLAVDFPRQIERRSLPAKCESFEIVAWGAPYLAFFLLTITFYGTSTKVAQ